MTAHSTAPPSVIDLGTPVWCWAKLGSGSEGVLTYTGERGRASLAVPYVLIDRQIAIELASFNETGLLAAGGTVTLEVNGVGAEGLRWVVRATGHADRADRSPTVSPPEDQEDHPGEHHAGDDSSAGADHIRLLVRRFRLRGFYESSTVADDAEVDETPDHENPDHENPEDER